MKHKHAELIKLLADGVWIDCRVRDAEYWRSADLRDFDVFDFDFRISPNQPADADGWIPWVGGEGPAISERIDVRFKNWPTQENTTAGQWRWEIRDRETDITHYRIVKEKIKEKVKKWRWMFFYPAPIQPSSIYVSEPFTQAEAAKYFDGSIRQRVVPEWKMEVECDE